MTTNDLLATIFGKRNLTIYKENLEERYYEDEGIAFRKKKTKTRSDDIEEYTMRLHCLETQLLSDSIPELSEKSRYDNLPFFSWFENTISNSKREMEILCWFLEMFACLEAIGVSNPAYAVLSTDLFFSSRRSIESYIKKHGANRVAALINVLCDDTFSLPRLSLKSILESEDNLFKSLAERNNDIGYRLEYIENDEHGTCIYTDKLPMGEFLAPTYMFDWEIPD